ncbi:TPA: DUF1642 domain-containing protein [Listeria monocytogenes]|nr:DUF1642 domain-containing protein [Listeria monocytogenes]HDT8574740.1 DUF1642 domain-containing protein [Listeria monocytogenes]HDT8598655.1 DUF1642 domain-containing protein [Listeria monocytogenes]HDT8681539.1 DUF1642 domain-containing protein [Listeria monocytogenes]HDT9092166.1 DUF1642 domain-containing protein [Listeria monocytogenes]
MRFKKGDKVEFIYGGTLTQGVVNEIRATNHDISYQIVYFGGEKKIWFAERELLSPAPVLKVPQFVADWYEQHRHKLEYSIWGYIYDWDDQDCESDFYDFMKNDNLKPVETVIKMKDGYEVEKEPVWVVENENGYRLRSITMNPGNSLNWSFDSKNKNYIEFEEFETAKKAAYLVTGNVTEI